MDQILDGKMLADKICQNLKSIVSEYNGANYGNGMKLVIVSTGNEDASKVYVNSKKKRCSEIGIIPITLHYDFLSKAALNDLVDELEDLDYPPFIIQLPIVGNVTRCDVFNALTDNINNNERYRNINSDELIKRMDVDGLISTINLIAQTNPEFFFNSSPDLLSHINLPCTPLGIIALLDYYEFSYETSHAVILGRSELVGKPLERMLLDRNCTVTMMHSYSGINMIHQEIVNADLLITAMGNTSILNSDVIFNTGAWRLSNLTVIDVGINRDKNGNLCGDFDPSLYNQCKQYTPVPGGVGPMTVAMLMCNVVKYYQDTYDHKYAGAWQPVYPMKFYPNHIEVYQ